MGERRIEETDLEEDIEDMILSSRIPLSFSDIKVRKPELSERHIYKRLESAVSRGYVDYYEVDVGNRKVKYYKEKCKSENSPKAKLKTDDNKSGKG